MPYIKSKARDYYKHVGNLDDVATALCTICLPNAKGDLNYIITYLVKRYLAEHGVSYFTASAMIDAVHDAECELRRRVLDPYEDKKIKENGDV